MLTTDKRGVTPLMATILLVSFAVAVGVVVMSFGSAEVEDSAVCPIDIGFKFTEIGGKPDFCYDGTQVRFTVENGINVNIEGLIVNVIGKEKVETYELAEKISKAANYVGKVSFDTSVGGEIRQFKVSPQVSLKGVNEICQDQALVLEEIPPC
ncbi:hypothetical protein HYT52_04820 [Candidatus Woesearchaeota archaeon]|nr:hypothetical protein [Candidatus Woesearchaeota archaeon]